MENEKFNTGIYQIVNLLNGKRYIGSAINLKRRKIEHSYRLKKQIHSNEILQRSYNKYGKENLKFEILLYCSKGDLLFYEQRAIDSYDFENLYNIRIKADSNRGITFSEEHKQKIRNSKKGNKSHMYGKKLSIETKIKISNKLKNRKMSETHKLNLCKALKNKKKSSEHIKKMKECQKGEKSSKFIKFSDIEINLMKKMRNQNFSYREIGRIFGHCSKIIKNRILYY